MKKLLFVFLFIFSTSATLQAKGIPIPVCLPCEEITVTHELPDEEVLKQEGYYLDLGYIYEEYGAVFLPFWNTDGKYVLYNDSYATYYEISDEELQKLKETYNLELDSNPLGLWASFGGKFILLAFIGLVIYGIVSKSDDDEETKPTPNSNLKN